MSNSTNLIKRLDLTHLYFTNNGLFNDNFVAQDLPSSKNPTLIDMWDTEEELNDCYEWMMQTWNKKRKEFEGLSEAQLEEEWIKPVLEKLNWSFEVQKRIKVEGKTQIPDYALFDTDRQKTKARSSKTAEGYFSNSLAVADAKKMNINLDGDLEDNTNPSFQIVKYMKDTGKAWGILTDGRYWRLYSLHSKNPTDAYFEVNVEKFINKRNDKLFKYFFNFFRKDAFLPLTNNLEGKCFLDLVFDEGRSYATQVEKKLKKRAFAVLEEICKGFAEKQDVEEEDLKLIYEESVYFLFRLMFILNCEAKGILRINSESDYFDHSLRKICLDIKTAIEGGRNFSSQTKLYRNITDLMKLLSEGDPRLGIYGLGAEFLKVGKRGFYDKNSIPDYILSKAISTLAFSEGKDGLEFIDFKRLSPDHLGSIFEGLLEFKFTFAEQDMITIGDKVIPLTEAKSKKKKINNSDIIKKGSLFLASDKGERKNLGAYYTPDFVVDEIVKLTLDPLLKERHEIEEILDLKILDPSMGSGHFLLGALKYLENEIMDRAYSHDNTDPIDPASVRWEVLKSCLFGLDINKMAVDLAKISLWMYSVRPGYGLEPLDDQLKAEDTLLMNDPWKNEEHHIGEGLFDVVIGNPPYLGEKGNKEIFRATVKANPDMKTVSKGKMDYFYFFIYAGLEYLKDGGNFGFITTAYWKTADGAEKLRSYLSENITIQNWYDFGEAVLFEDAPGQHNLIQVFSKNRRKHKVDLKHYVGKKRLLNEISFKKEWDSQKLSLRRDELSGKSWNIFQHFDSKDKATITVSSSNLLNDYYHVGCGVRSTADTLTEKKLGLLDKSVVKKYGLKKGSGIFVLSETEAKRLSKSLNSVEKGLMKKWYKNSDIGPFSVSDKNSLYHLYVTNKIDQKKIPNIIKHLEIFKPVLEFKKKNYGEANLWYAVNRASEDSVTKSEKVITPYRSKFNAFAYSNSELYGSMDLYFITYKDPKNPPSLSLKALAAILNSKQISVWCKKNMKRKGDMMEFYATPLKNIPLPNISEITPVISKKLEGIYDKLSETENPLESKYYKELNSIVDEIYESEVIQAA